MKRASLLETKLNRTPAEAGKPDLTDRLLGQAADSPSNPQAKAAPRKKRGRKAVPSRPSKSQAKKKDRPEAPSAGRREDALAFVPYRPVPESQAPETRGPRLAPPNSAPEASGDDDALAKALLQAEKAVGALISAADSAPAKFDLAIRYRLDALAHHLEQVADFIRSTAQK